MMYVAIVAVTVVLAALFWFFDMRRSAVFYGAVFAVGGYAALTIPDGWHALSAIFVAFLTVIGFVWQWVRVTRGGSKFPWNRMSVRGIIALPFAVSVNLLAIPEGFFTDMNAKALSAAFDESFGAYLSAVVYLLAIYLTPRIIYAVRHLLAPKVSSE